MTAFLLLTRTSRSSAAFLLLLGVVTALGFGVLWTLSFGRSMRRLMRRIYEGDPAIVPPPPEGEYDYRLPCSYMASPRMAVGGHLYIGPTKLTFMPHRKNLKRHQIPVSVPVEPSLALEAIVVKLRGLTRLIVRGPLYRLRISGPAGEAAFAVPEAHSVTARLRRYLEEASSRGAANEGAAGDSQPGIPAP